MKKVIFTSLLSALVLSACTKTTTEKNVSSNDTLTLDAEKPAFAYDSLRVGDSLDVTPLVSAKYNQKVLVFEGLERNVLDSLYKEELYDSIAPSISYSKDEVQALLEERKSKYYTDTKANVAEFQPGSKQTWDQVSEMNVVSNENDYLTVKYTGYGYTGGAHGYAYEKYKVADLKNQIILKLSDIVDVTKVNWNEVLLQHMDERKDGLFEPQNLTYNSNFYFDSKGITFTYNQYEIAAYVYGIIPVTVPFEAIKSALKPDFKQRMGIK